MAKKKKKIEEEIVEQPPEIVEDLISPVVEEILPVEQIIEQPPEQVLQFTEDPLGFKDEFVIVEEKKKLITSESIRRRIKMLETKIWDGTLTDCDSIELKQLRKELNELE